MTTTTCIFEPTHGSFRCATCGLEDQYHTFPEPEPIEIELIVNPGEATIKYNGHTEAETWPVKVGEAVSLSHTASVPGMTKLNVFDGDVLTLVGTDFMNVTRIVLEHGELDVAGQNFEITYRGDRSAWRAAQ
jgi:hypothetical protein